MEVLAAFSGARSLVEMVIEKKVGGYSVWPGLQIISMREMHYSW